MDVVFVTCQVLPEPDPDMAPLLAACERAGLRVAAWAWDDPGVDWSAAPLTVLRSPWNYHRDRDGFLAWARQVARQTRLWNPVSVLEWNSHKGYLLDLEARGISVTPTRLIRRDDPRSLVTTLDGSGWEDVVVKPAVGASSEGARRFGAASLEQGEQHLRELLARGDALVQQYLSGVESYGERAVIWVHGELTHAVRKSARLAGDAESVEIVPIAADEREFALAVLEAIDTKLLYARIDIAPGIDGRPCLMELELMEPSLYFAESDASLARYVAALRAV